MLLGNILTFQTIENLNNHDNQEWHWTGFTILAMYETKIMTCWEVWILNIVQKNFEILWDPKIPWKTLTDRVKDDKRPWNIHIYSGRCWNKVKMGSQRYLLLWVKYPLWRWAFQWVLHHCAFNVTPCMLGVFAWIREALTTDVGP